MTNYLKVLVLSLVIAVFSQATYSAWGDFDTSFGFLGAAADGVTNHYPRGMALQADGKILVTGFKLVGGKERFFLRRYLSNGQLDTSFGNTGAAISNALININSNYRGNRIVVQANGKIAVVGRGNDLPAVWRFHSSGYADTVFGSNGGMKILSAYTGSTPSIATYSNNLYVAVLKSTPASTVILKYDSSGAPDTSFGTNGEALTDANSTYSMDVDPTTGNILIGGRRRSDPSDYGIERFLATGVVDPTFTHWGAAYAGWLGSYPSDFVRLANGEFILNERSYNIASGGATISANYVRLSSGGNFTSRTQYEPSEFVIGVPAGACPDLTEQQQDGRVVLKGANSDELFRFSTDFSTVETMPCSSYQSMDLGSRTPALLQTDDKMVAAGTYGGYIVIVRTLP